jgi:ferritin-like protein
MARQTSPKTIQTINTGIFPATIMFSNGLEYDEIIKELSKIKADEWVSGLSGDKEIIDKGFAFGLYRSIENIRTKQLKHLYYIILKDSFDFSDYHYVVLAHEIIHICQFVSDGMFDRNKEIEAEAYLHSHIMTQCLNILRTKPPTRKRK